jgi:hypothetical protein
MDVHGTQYARHKLIAWLPSLLEAPSKIFLKSEDFLGVQNSNTGNLEFNTNSIEIS